MSQINSFKNILCLIVSFFFISGCNSLPSKKVDPVEILKNVEKKYDSMTQYHDIGRTNSSYGIDTKFETYFKKKQNKKFFLYKLFLKDNIQNLVSNRLLCSNLDGVFGQVISSNSKKDEKFVDLKIGISKNLIASEGNLRLIPSLFFENLGFHRLTSLEYNKFLGMEKLNGDLHYHIFVSQDINSKLKGFHLWIDKDNLIIKKIKRIFKKTEIEYFYDEIEVNNIINDSVFEESCE